MSACGCDRCRIVLLGLGNTVLTDDGIGVHVVRSVADAARALGADVAEAEVGGFALVEMLAGYDAAVVVDAARFPGAQPGTVEVHDLSEFAPSLHLVAAHQVDLPSALALGQALGIRMPGRVSVVTVQVSDDRTFSESCTAAVAAAAGTAGEAALALIGEYVRC